MAVDGGWEGVWTSARWKLGLALSASIVVLVSVPFDLLPWLRGPAPYPPEWQWGYRTGGPAEPLFAAGACALAVLMTLAFSFSGPARRHPRPAARLLVATAVVLGFGFSLALLAREPGGPFRALIARERSRTETSYLAVARSEEAHDPLAFLRRHAEILPSLVSRARHAATHPPGPVLYFRAALAVTEASPRLSEAVLRGTSVLEAGVPGPAARPAWAAALLGALGLVLAGSLAAWPLARLGEALGLLPLDAARLALLWALLPGPALMAPQFDQALALPVTGSAVLLLAGARATRGLDLARCGVLAGCLGGLALFVSYGSGAFLAIAGLGALATAGLRPRALASAALAALASAVIAFGVPGLLGHEPIRAMRTALALHREIYTEPRSHVLWLLFNPLDFALFLGAPVAVIAAARVAEGLGRARRGLPLDPSLRFHLGVAAGLVALVLLGVTRGEVGRIWIPLMPLVLASSVTDTVASPGPAPSVLLGSLLGLLSLALASWLL